MTLTISALLSYENGDSTYLLKKIGSVETIFLEPKDLFRKIYFFNTVFQLLLLMEE